MNAFLFNMVVQNSKTMCTFSANVAFEKAKSSEVTLSQVFSTFRVLYLFVRSLLAENLHIVSSSPF